MTQRINLSLSDREMEKLSECWHIWMDTNGIDIRLTTFVKQMLFERINDKDMIV